MPHATHYVVCVKHEYAETTSPRNTIDWAFSRVKDICGCDEAQIVATMGNRPFSKCSPTGCPLCDATQAEMDAEYREE